MWPFKRRDVIGLDIGSSAVKLVELKATKKGWELSKLGEAPLPRESILNKSIVNPEAVAGALSELIQSLRIKTRDVAVSISGNAVIIKRISLPKMNRKDIDASVVWEIEQSVTQRIEEINYDFQALSTENAEGNTDVLIVIAKKDVANTYTSVVREVGLNPVVVDVDAFALENMYELNYKHEDSAVALVDVGASLIHINILKGGYSVFTTDITIGGNQLTELIQRELNVGFDAAEKKKRSALSAGDSDLDRVSREFTETMCREIQKTLDFFSSTLSKDEVTKIMLGGGASKIPQLRESLEEFTGASVEIINPFKNISYNEMEFDSEYMQGIAPKMGVAVGLALRRGDEKL
ncbi:MAG: type IV pilus assembly protein PilM [Deltaproteobacteria bacterium]